ncbi:type II secretion system F family protein [Glaesserella sp.]|uniref:type II secretion system F family protein n=1 Tax=Glaesserella sp. TaxID=2094731 RepID=UPI0035A0475A
MPRIYQFHWKAINRFQQKQQGKYLAQSRDKVEKQLLEKGYQHIRIQRNFVLSQKPKQSEITQLIRQLALLINAAIPLKQSLSMLLENCENGKLYLWLNGIIQQIEAGFSFSSALEKQSTYLQPQEIQLIKMGEASGNLSTILSNIAHSREKFDKMMKKVRKILFYPLIILSISVSLSLLLLIFIVPKFADLYSSKKATLPLITEMLFFLSEFLQQHIQTLLLFGLLTAVCIIILAKKTSLIRRFNTALLGRLPIFNSIIHQSRIIYFCQNCGLMLGAHLRLDLILHSFLSAKQSDPILEKEVQFMLILLKQGYRFSEGLNPMVFNSDVIQMIATGERSGQLAKMLEHVSETYQQKLDYQIDILSQLLEPMLMLVMGVIVGTIIVGLYLPIFDMGGVIS